MTKAEKRAARRVKRSKFLTRMVDEFKKIVLIVMFPTVVGFLVWEHILYQNNVALPASIPIALISGLFGTIITYCIASYKEKDSLNKNGLAKGSDGVIKKVVSSAAGLMSGISSEESNATEDEDTEDSDETPISSCKSSDHGGES